MAGVAFENVTKRFGDVTVVDNLSLQVADQAFLVIVGPSGCGKTTILRLLAGLEKVSEGVIRIGGRVVNDTPPRNRGIAMVFESDALYPHLTVEENLAFSLALRKTPAEKRGNRIREAVSTMKLPAFRSRKPKSLSEGQRKQTAIGRAMVHEPELFLMDEPLANLDATLRAATRAEIKKLHQRLATTFIYVTHDQMEAMALGDRIAIIKEGVLQQVGGPQAVYNRPDNVFVAGFIGSPPMNILKATLVHEDGTLWVDAGAFRVALPPEKHLRGFQAYHGREILFGFRPEHVHAPRLAPAGIQAEAFKARLDAVELLGSKLYLHLTTGGQAIVATVDARLEPEIGRDIELLLEVSQIHLFDPETGLAIR